MDIERIHEMLEKLTECAKEQFDKGISSVDTCEMGAVVDIIKDLAEAEYYRTLTSAMNDSSAEETMEMYDRYSPKYRKAYSEPPYYRMTPEMYRDMDRDIGRMYFTETSASSKIRDAREGRSGISRRTYMENKELHKANTPQDKEAKMHDLNVYMTELADDMTEIINDATPEEKTVLRNKLSALVTKIV